MLIGVVSWLSFYFIGLKQRLSVGCYRRLYLRAHRSHLLARIGATATGFNALHHHLVAARDALTVISARGAHFGAHSASARMKLRAANHKGGACGADVRAIKQERDVCGFGVLTAET